MADQTEILLFGLGAIGSFYAFILNRMTNVRLTVVARSNYDAVKENGLVIDRENRGRYTCWPDKVVKTPAEAPGHYDYIVCTNKAVDPESVPRQLAAVVDDRTTLVIIQNGVGNEEPFRRAYPGCTILTCVTWVGSSQTAPGIVSVWSEHTQIGLYVNEVLDFGVQNQSLHFFTSLLLNGGTSVTVEPNMQEQRWKKAVWNAAWNCLSTLTMLRTRSWLDSSPEAMPLTRRLMREMIDVARGCNVPLQYDLIDQLIDKILSMPDISTSMLNDRKIGRQTEVEVIIGTPIRKAREFGLDVPTLETVYALIKGLEYHMKKESC